MCEWGGGGYYNGEFDVYDLDEGVGDGLSSACQSLFSEVKTNVSNVLKQEHS